MHDFSEDQFCVKKSSDSKTISKSKSQPMVNEINTIKIELSKEMLINACVEMVTVNGRPFSLMEDSGFQKILEPIKNGFVKKKGKDFSLSAESIQKYVSLEATKLRETIIEEVKHGMVSVKVDGVTRLDRSFLGINIQYVKNAKIMLRTVALKEISQHTGKCRI